MSRLSDVEVFEKLFVHRTHSFPLLIGAMDTSTGSRIGSRAPACFDEAVPRCPFCLLPMLYFLTLAHDSLGGIIGNGRALSVFYCRDFKCLLRSWTIQAQPSLILMSHPDCDRSSSSSDAQHHSSIEGRCLSLGLITTDLDEYGQPKQGSKIGGQPGLIQGPEIPDKLNILRSRNLGFLFQFDEESVPNDMHYGTAPFAFGVFYTFCQFDLKARMIHDLPTVAFWQQT